jgi:hypothetical protein
VYDLAIQQRDKEIVLGTHGRSIYTAKIGALQQLTTDLLKEELAILDFDPPLLPAGGGGRRGGGGRFGGPAPVLEIPYYISTAGVVTLQVFTDKGVLAATRTDTAKGKGIQFFKYDMKMDAGATTLRAGDYEAVLSLPNGKKVSKKFTLKVSTEQFQQFGEEEEEEEEF